MFFFHCDIFEDGNFSLGIQIYSRIASICDDSLIYDRSNASSL